MTDHKLSAEQLKAIRMFIFWGCECHITIGKVIGENTLLRIIEECEKALEANKKA